MAKSRTPRTAARKAAAKRKTAKRSARARKTVRKTGRKAAAKTARRAARPAASRRRKATKAVRPKARAKATSRKTVKKSAKRPTRASATRPTRASVAKRPVVKATPARVPRAAAPNPTKAAKPVQPVRKPALDRERRRLPEASLPPSPPSSLDLDQRASAARSGRREIEEHLSEHNETGPVITAGDIDANWETAYSTGDEAPGGDNPTPDQDVVDEIGRSLGLEYNDNEELKGADKVEARDRHRWELDPASSEDYDERD